MKVRLGRKSLVLFLVVLLVMGATGGIFFMVMLRRAEFRNSASATSSTGLRLYVSLNSTLLRRGQSVNISIQEYNPLVRAINISRSDKWPVRGLSLGPCGTLNFPMGMAVYAGYYTTSDIFLGMPLPLYNPDVIYNFPIILSNIDHYVFYPESDVAQVFGSCIPNPCFAMSMAADMLIGGLWLTRLCVQFPPGIYTVAAGDEWGTMALLHFVVTP